MSGIFSASNLRLLLLGVLAVFLFAGCEPVDDRGPTALKLRSAVPAGFPPNTKVDLHAGEETWSDRTDFNNVFNIRFEEEAEPAEDEFVWITVTVTLVSGESLVFETLVGEYGELVAAAEDGLVTPTEFPRSRVTSLRAVESVLLTQANGGEAVREQTLVDSLMDELDPLRLLDAATVLDLFVQEGGPIIPDEVDSIASLAGNDALLADTLNEAGETWPHLLTNSRARALRDTDLRGGWETADDIASRYAVFMPRFPAVSGEVFRFNPDQTGTLGAPEGKDTFTWHLQDGVVHVDFAGDMTWRGRALLENEDGEQEVFDFTEHFESTEFHRITSGTNAELVFTKAEIRREYDRDDLHDPITRTAINAQTGWMTMMDAIPADVAGTWTMNLARQGLDEPALKVVLDANNTGEVILGPWQEGSTIEWQANGGELHLIAGDQSRVEIEFLRESIIGFSAIVREMDDTGSVVAETVELVEHGDRVFEDSDMPGLYLPFGGVPQPGATPRAKQYHLTETGDGDEFNSDQGTPVKWVLEQGDVVIRHCQNPDDGTWMGLEAEPTEEDNCGWYRRRAWDAISTEPADNGENVMVVETFKEWRLNELSEEPDNARRQLMFLTRETADSSSSVQAAPSPTAQMAVPGRGYRDFDIDTKD